MNKSQAYRSSRPFRRYWVFLGFRVHDPSLVREQSQAPSAVIALVTSSW